MDGAGALRLRHRARRDRLDSTDEFWGGRTVEPIHIDFAPAIAAFVALHVAGVVVTAIVCREKLVAAMLHGRKREASDGDVI